MTAAARSRSSASSCTSISGISIGARLPVPDVTPATPAKGWAAALLGHAAVAGGGSPTGTVVRNRRGEVGQELVDDPQVVRREHQVEPALLAVELPAAVLHDVADRAQVVDVGGDPHPAHDRVAGDRQAVDGLEPGPVAAGGVASPAAPPPVSRAGA